MDRKTLHSVGIDIGTTTTQVIFSRLTLVNRAPATQVPQYEFIEREIAYESPVSFTPIDSSGVIDAERLQAFIHKQFAAAGLALKAIETGAIIITGETSKAHNAREAIMDLADQLGDFVVATAGPHLESIIAGRGSGAAEYAKAHHKCVLNIDIGGGTSNYVVFKGDRVVDTACLNVGGRLLEVSADGGVSRIHKPARMIVDDLFGPQIKESDMTPDHIRRVACRMAEMVVEVACGKQSSLATRLLMTESLKPHHEYDAVFLSGGVGACYYQSTTAPIAAHQFNDVGPLLAEELMKNAQLNGENIMVPIQTLRATVIGAGAYSLSLSGSTIWLKTADLPIRNVPVVHPNIDWQSEAPAVCEETLTAANRMDLDLINDRYAISLDASMPMTYTAVLRASEQLAEFYQRHGNRKAPALLVVQNDIGKVLGMELGPLLAPQELAVIDEVVTHDGDYIDIGESYFGGEIVPLTVKSLAFPS
ncbi:Uncharacterised protein [BD1-7 clade bacterium]|uniref:Reactivating factor for ethanolamine ammonia lyase n=1 Tax=BD1-7 clade bacterium TaxID=2029982 RepID=A0A5S9QHN0_9GAMM|nr:Uncharacterised protein [BD1-7 clade bacterium]CAA0117183.1 Uncharacterised protein [BD1-7 clade bacterium]